jgi:hypothetical protein
VSAFAADTHTARVHMHAREASWKCSVHSHPSLTSQPFGNLSQHHSDHTLRMTMLSSSGGKKQALSLSLCILCALFFFVNNFVRNSREKAGGYTTCRMTARLPKSSFPSLLTCQAAATAAARMITVHADRTWSRFAKEETCCCSASSLTHSI